jgi:hypothetical protein
MPWFDLADGEHNGYGRLPDPVTHRRVVMFLKPDTWFIWDEIRGQGPHELELLFHVRPDCHVDVAPRGEACLTSPDGQRLNVWVSGEAHQPVELAVLHGDEQNREAWFSPGYGVRLPSRALSVTRRFDARCSLVTCFLAPGLPRPIVTQDQAAVRVRVNRGEGCQDSLFYRTEGLGPLIAEGVRFDGTLLFHRTVTSELSVIRGRCFRELSLDGLLYVEGSTIIDSLALEKDHCEIAIDPNHASRLRISVREGISVVVNGRPHPIGVATVPSVMVMS